MARLTSTWLRFTGPVAGLLVLLCAVVPAEAQRPSSRPLADGAQPAPVRLTLISGDNASAAGVSAAADLRLEPALAGVAIRILFLVGWFRTSLFADDEPVGPSITAAGDVA